MKKYIGLMLSCVALISCEEFENSAEKSVPTYLPVMTVNGETEVELACDATGYTDAGAEANEGGSPIEVETVTTGTFFGGTLAANGTWTFANVPVDGPDAYVINYSAYNKDSIPAAAFRHVYWPACNDDLTQGIAGVYTADVVRYDAAGAPSPGATGPYYGVGPMLIKDLGAGVYQLSDVLGGWYVYGRGLGYAYGAPGITIKVNNLATNDFTHDKQVRVLTFGGLARITDFSVDPVAGNIKFTSTWDSGYRFEVTLTPAN